MVIQQSPRFQRAASLVKMQLGKVTFLTLLRKRLSCVIYTLMSAIPEQKYDTLSEWPFSDLCEVCPVLYIVGSDFQMHFMGMFLGVSICIFKKYSGSDFICEALG